MNFFITTFFFLYLLEYYYTFDKALQIFLEQSLLKFNLKFLV